MLSHPVFWTYTCIINSLKINHRGDETEPDLANNVLPWYSFEIEFWEHKHSNTNNDMNKFFPSIAIRPPSDLYAYNLKYRTCDELYQAIIDWNILPWLDPIVNAEWLKYDYVTMRKCAYDRYLANPNGENSGTTFDSKGNIKAKTSTWTTTTNSNNLTNNGSKILTVKVGQTVSDIAKLYATTTIALYTANKGRKVRTRDYKYINSKWVTVNEGKERKTSRLLQPWDTILVPNTNPIEIKFNSSLYWAWNIIY